MYNACLVLAPIWDSGLVFVVFPAYDRCLDSSYLSARIIICLRYSEQRDEVHIMRLFVTMLMNVLIMATLYPTQNPTPGRSLMDSKSSGIG